MHPAPPPAARPSPTAARTLAVVAVGLALTLLQFQGRPACAEAPRPSPVPRTWQFDLDWHMPQLIELDTDDDGVIEFYWYMRYTVTNDTGADRLFVPHIQVLTNTGDLTTAGRGISAEVFDAIDARHENPLLQSPVDVIGKLLQGEDNARDSVAIWQPPAEDVDSMRLFFAGLSGDTAVVPHPDADANLPGEPDEIILRKNLVLDFKTPGGSIPVQRRPIKFVEQTWVMR